MISLGRHLARIALVASVAAQATDSDTSEPGDFAVENPQSWGSPDIIVSPEYPKEALARQQSGYVDIDGVVSPLRTLDDVRLTPDSADSAPFVDAVREVIRYWTFHPPFKKDCWPSHERIVTRVWFEVADGKPHISVSRRTFPDWAGRRRHDKPVIQVNPRYPMFALDRGLEAIVYASVHIDREGHVTAVETQAYEVNGSDEVQPFRSSVEAALRGWRFEAATADDKDLRWYCYTVIFHDK